MDDNFIIHLLNERSENALTALARQFGAHLHRIAANILSDPRDAEETVSDTYLAVWNTIPPQQPKPLAPYVYRIGRNTALKRLRSNTAQKRDTHADLCLDELAGCIPGGALEQIVQARELGRAIDRFLDTVTTESRRIFLRRYWFVDSIEQIAQDFGMSANAVTVRLSRTREKLRTFLIKEGYHE